MNARLFLESFFPSFETAVLPIDILHEIQTQLRRAVGAYGVREPEECEVTNSSDALGDRGAFAFSQGSGLFSRHSRLRGNLFPGHLLAIRIEIAGIALLDAIVHNISDTDRERTQIEVYVAEHLRRHCHVIERGLHSAVSACAMWIMRAMINGEREALRSFVQPRMAFIEHGALRHCTECVSFENCDGLGEFGTHCSFKPAQNFFDGVPCELAVGFTQDFIDDGCSRTLHG